MELICMGKQKQAENKWSVRKRKNEKRERERETEERRRKKERDNIDRQIEKKNVYKVQKNVFFMLQNQYIIEKQETQLPATTKH